MREAPDTGRLQHPRNTTRARALRNAATPAERRLWQALSRSRQGAKFSRQMPVGPFFADFLCRELKLVVECDGTPDDRDVAAMRGVIMDDGAWLRGAALHQRQAWKCGRRGLAIREEITRPRGVKAWGGFFPEVGGGLSSTGPLPACGRGWGWEMALRGRLWQEE